MPSRSGRSRSTICSVGQIAAEFQCASALATRIGPEKCVRRKTNFARRFKAITKRRPSHQNIPLSFLQKSCFIGTSRLIEKGRTRRHDTRGGDAVDVEMLLGRVVSTRT
jgi:hypothetical protein